jgi:hypothetical protein
VGETVALVGRLNRFAKGHDWSESRAPIPSPTERLVLMRHSGGHAPRSVTLGAFTP